MPRRRIPLPRPENKLESRAIIIAAEGQNTERIYFEKLAEHYYSTEIHVEIIERSEGESNPERVLEDLDEFANKYQFGEKDELWLIIDRDSQSWNPDKISFVAQRCHQKKGYYLGLSNPAFEIWLLLHIKDISDYPEDQQEKIFENKKITKHRTVLKKELSVQMPSGFNESHYDAEYLVKRVKDAIQRARRMDKNPKSRWPNYLGTRVYRLAEKIIKGK